MDEAGPNRQGQNSLSNAEFAAATTNAARDVAALASPASGDLRIGGLGGPRRREEGGLGAFDSRKKRRVRVLLVCASNCIISLLSTVYYYIELRRFKDYPFFTTQLNALMSVGVAALGLGLTHLVRPKKSQECEGEEDEPQQSLEDGEDVEALSLPPSCSRTTAAPSSSSLSSSEATTSEPSRPSLPRQARLERHKQQQQQQRQQQRQQQQQQQQQQRSQQHRQLHDCLLEQQHDPIAQATLPPIATNEGAEHSEAPNCCSSRPAYLRWVELAFLMALQISMETACIPRIGNDNLPPVLQQAVVPLTFLLATLILKASYTYLQLFGATLVVLGVSCGFVATALQQHHSLGNIDGVAVSWFLCSRIPQALSNVLGEGILSSRNGIAWVFRTTLYVQIMAIPFNFLSAMLVSKMFGSMNILEDYSGGIRCLLWGEGGSQCPGSWQAAAVFAVPGAAYLISEFQVLQHASATTYFLLAALQLPLQDLLLSLPLFHGALDATFHPILLVQIVIVTAGLTIYALGVGEQDESETEPPIQVHGIRDPAPRSRA